MFFAFELNKPAAFTTFELDKPAAFTYFRRSFFASDSASFNKLFTVYLLRFTGSWPL
jgi:hypothetical protein